MIGRPDINNLLRSNTNRLENLCFEWVFTDIQSGKLFDDREIVRLGLFEQQPLANTLEEPMAIVVAPSLYEGKSVAANFFEFRKLKCVMGWVPTLLKFIRSLIQHKPVVI